MKRTRFFLFVCMPIMLGTIGLRPAEAAPPDARVSVTNTLTTEARTNNLNGNELDDNYQAMINRFNLKLVSGDLTAVSRLDAMSFRKAPSEAFVDDARFERLTLQYRKGPWKFLGGDYYRQLGRGILLAVRKVDEAGLDLSLRGGQVQYDGDTHRSSVFGGILNPSNLDSISQKFIEDTTDLIAGGHYEFAGIESFQVGVMSLFTQPEETSVPESLLKILGKEGEKDRTMSAGTYIQVPELAEDVSVYFEADVQQRQVAGADDATLGMAAYVTADIVVSDFIILAEGLYLNDWEQRGTRNSALDKRFDYNYAPTLERIDQEVFENLDTLGGRLRTEYLIEAWDLLLYVNGMIRINDINRELKKPDSCPTPSAELVWSAPRVRQLHGFTGFEYEFNDGASRLFGSTGYRDEKQQKDPSMDPCSPPTYQYQELKTMFHAEFDYLHAIGEDLALHIVSNNEFRTLEENRYERGSTLIGVEKAGTAALTVEVGYDTQDTSAGVANLFLAAILSWDINDVFRLRATAGTQRGGIKCIAGVCRDYPEFAGAKAELVTRL